MTRCWRRCSFQLAIASSVLVGAAIASLGDCALAQIKPDGTLPNNSIVTPQRNASVIVGGTQAGSNLFHSFEQFSVPTNGVAFFNNALDIQNIFSRVTGKSISNIDGLIRANGTANLFLLNPNGIIFGPNARLSIGGSFLGSTASSLNFADGTQFSATARPTTPLLTVSVPLGLQFGGTAGSILNQSQANPDGATNRFGLPVGLEVQLGKTLALVGGNVALAGGTLTAAGGRIELGSIAGTGLVSLNPIDFGWVLGYEGVQNFLDIQLSQQATVDASGEGGGNIQVQGRRITLSDTSSINADTLGSQNGGGISIQGFKLIAQDGSQISVSTSGAGQGGNLSVTADSIKLRGTSADGQFPSSLFAQVEPEATGKGGDLAIRTGQLSIQDGAELNVSSEGLGNAGELNVSARAIWLDNQGKIRAESASGQGGNITLRAQDLLLLRRNSRISTSAGAGGNAGNISLDQNTLVITDEKSDITANSLGGRGGFIDITAQLFISPMTDVVRFSLLPKQVVDVTDLITQGCSSGVRQGKSEFIVTGHGGLPPSPTEPLSSDAIWVDLVTLKPRIENSSSSLSILS